MITLSVNRKPVQVEVSDDTPLLWTLRDHLKLTGTKYGCGMALCGACTVHVDGVATRSGQIMSASALLAKNKRPSDSDIDAAMAGNVCRCATYVRIRAAIKEAAAKLA